MAEILNLGGPIILSRRKLSSRSHFQLTKHDSITQWSRLQHKLRSNGRFLCLFSDNKREEQARKALEGALSGKKNEFDKWDKEIKRKEELGGGGDTGGGGWFGWGRWFGWSNDDNFWREAKQASLTLLGIVLMYLLVAKGDLILAITFNPLLYALRGVRNGFGFITSKISTNTSTSNQPDFDGFLKKEDYKHASAKENVVRKWGSDY
ncbi:uncharacterized protein LOC133286436 [Gastrolobium bilobum]|uniref:uncharacterized protein LOC133286436 n=1 Tax=Gastrolobium bilobum TaxID=150636 RepID=UPI002AB1C1A9|nr:uncharacterized protein LOC133286436 [Gastrolobium bilobum]